jgi:hypothetical protein
MPSALGELIEAEDTMVGPRHLARQAYLPPTDQAPSEIKRSSRFNGRVVPETERPQVGPETC